jgi:hypothetical protein
MRLFVATAINLSREGRSLSQLVALWSKAGMPFTMYSNAKDTWTLLVISADFSRKCSHP